MIPYDSPNSPTLFKYPDNILALSILINIACTYFQLRIANLYVVEDT